MRIPRSLLAAALLTTALPLTACSGAPATDARVVVKVAPSVAAGPLDVYLAQRRAGFRSEFRMQPGQTRSVAVPKGWVTVRVAGLCVVPTPTAGTTTVVVRPNDCTVA